MEEALQVSVVTHGVSTSSESYKREFPSGCKPTSIGSITSFSGQISGVKRGYPLSCGPTSETTFSGRVSGKKRSLSDIYSGRVSGTKRSLSEIYSLEENYLWWRKVSASKSKPSTTEKIKKPPLLKTGYMGSKNNNNGGIREKLDMGSKNNNNGGIREKLDVFRKKCKELSRVSVEKRGTHRIDFKAMQELRKQGMIGDKVRKVMGSIPGVEIGDHFDYRVELMIVGLHSRNQNGIDYMMVKGGDLVATCIVATEGYPDKTTDHELLTYIGEGGIYGREDEHPKDQKMEKGNLALKNSAEFGYDVRVVKGVKYGTRYGDSSPKITYVYDGLYKVFECKAKRGLKNNVMFEFKLRRNPGQPFVPWHRFKSG